MVRRPQRMLVHHRLPRHGLPASWGPSAFPPCSAGPSHMAKKIPFVSEPVRWHNGRREVALGIVPVEWLKPAAYNPRTMAEDARERLERGLDHFGIVDTLVAAENGDLLGGHQRLTSELRRGATTVPVFVVYSLGAAEKKAVNVLLNNPSTQGQWDMPKLTALLSELDGEGGIDATLTGFSEQELEQLLTSVAPLEEPERDPSTDDQYGVVVLCQSATHQEQVYARLSADGHDCKTLR